MGDIADMMMDVILDELYYDEKQNLNKQKSNIKTNNMSEIKTSKVKAVQGAGTFENSYGVDLGNGTKGFYKFEYTMEDGTTLTANHKSQDPFKVGEDVEYTITKSNNYGNMGKVSKPSEGNFSPSNGSKSYQRNQASIIAQYAFREANLMLISNGYGEDVNTTSQRLDKTTALAELILDKLVVLEQKAKDNGLG